MKGTRRSGKNTLTGLALAMTLTWSGAALADAGSVRYSYEKVEVGPTTEWVLVPRADLTLVGKPSDVTLKTAFEALKKDKRSTYLKSTITVTGKDPAKAKVVVNIDPEASRYALIIMAEAVYTLTELGASGVSFPGYADGVLNREDIPFSGYALTVPLWKALPSLASPQIMVRMSNGALEPSEKIVERWKAKDPALMNDLYTFLKAKDAYTVTYAAKVLPALKVPYAEQVAALLKDSRPTVRASALETLEGVRDEAVVLDAVLAYMNAEKDDAAAAKAAEFLGKAKDKRFSIQQHYFALTRGDEAAAVAAAAAIAGFKDERSVPLLVARLEDPRGPVANAAADALEAVKGVDAQKSALKNSKISAEVRLKIANHLASNSSDDARLDGLNHIALNDVEHKAVAAVESMAKIKGDAARTMVEAYLTHEQRYLRVASSQHLVKRGESASLPAFANAAKANKGEPNMEEAAFEIMLKESVNNIMTRTKDSNALIKRLAYRALGDRAQAENAGARVFGTLKDGLGNSDASIRGASARAMGAYGDDKAAEALKPLVKDKDASVRRDVALAIGRFKDGVLISELQVLLDDKNTSVQAAAIKSFGDRNEPLVWKRVVSSIGDKDPEIRAAAVESLAKLVARDDQKGVRETIGTLSAAVNDQVHSVQIAALKALGTFDSEQAVTGIAFQLGSNNDDVKLAAVHALGNTKHASAANVVANAAADENRNVRKAVIESLGQIKGPDSRKALEARAQREQDKELLDLISATLKKL